MNMQNLMSMQKLWSKVSALPSESFTIQATNWGNLVPNDATSYYIWNGVVSATLAATDIRIYVPKKCKMTKCVIDNKNWVTSTTEPSTISILVNWVTEYVISSTFVTNTTNATIVNTSLNGWLGIPLNEWDYFCIKWITPIWVTNPSNLQINAVCWFDCIPIVNTWSYLLQGWHIQLNPTASITNYFVDTISVTTDTANLTVPVSWTIVAAYIFVRVGITLASSEQFTYAIRLDHATDYTITSTATLSALSNTFTNTSLNVPVVWGTSVINLKAARPAWVTTPTNINTRFTYVIQR